MSTPSLSERHPSAPDTDPFRAITCGIDGTRAGFEAARQAAVLAQDGATLRFLAVTWETGTFASAMVALGRHRAEEALERARRLARDAGVHADCAVVDGPHAGERLLAASAGADLLVVGSSGHSHAGGLVLGHAATDVLRHAPCSVLIARPAAPHPFPGAVLVAADDPASARAAGAVAGALARRHATWAAVLAGGHRAAAEAGAAVRGATDVEPVAVEAHGRFSGAAAHVAADLGSSLIVTAGEHAERIAERAHCSVLVLRQRA